MGLLPGIRVLGLLLIGHAGIIALYWGLLNVPESTTLMLALSAIIAIVMVFLTGWLQIAVGLSALPELKPREAYSRGLTRWWAFFVAAVIFSGFWWLTHAILAWHESFSGEIDAWIMSRTGRTETAWVHRAIDIIVFLIRYIVGVSLSLAVLFAGARRGLSGLADRRWLRAGLSRRHMGTIGLAFVLLIALPLQVLYWRPDGLPPSQLQVAFVVAKLSLIFVLLNVGWLLALRTAAASE